MLQLPADPDDPQRLDRVRTALLAARLTRTQPGRDDKVVTAWNGLAITALAEASVALGAPGVGRRRAPLRDSAAVRCTSSTAGCAEPASAGVVGDSAAILEDHATLATGLLALYQLTADDAWLTAATDLLDIALAALRRSRTTPAAGSTPPTMPSS